VSGIHPHVVSAALVSFLSKNACVYIRATSELLYSCHIEVSDAFFDTQIRSGVRRGLICGDATRNRRTVIIGDRRCNAPVLRRQRRTSSSSSSPLSIVFTDHHTPCCCLTSSSRIVARVFSPPDPGNCTRVSAKSCPEKRTRVSFPST